MPQTAVNRLFDLEILPRLLQAKELTSPEWAIASSVIAYAAGDAFGAAHEFVPERGGPITFELLGKPEWPYGGVSDDTTLSLLTIASISEQTPENAARRYLDLLRESKETLRGLGPTTRYALGMSVKPEEVHYIGVSNGGMMRTALLGTLFSDEENGLRESWVRASVETTHSHHIAVDAALSMSAAFAGAVSRGTEYLCPTPPPNWAPPSSGISLDPLETYRAVMYVAQSSTSVEKAFLKACELGGDTDTVAALSGALVAAKFGTGSGLFEIPWLMDVKWEEIPQISKAIELMISRRREWVK